MLKRAKPNESMYHLADLHLSPTATKHLLTHKDVLAKFTEDQLLDMIDAMNAEINSRHTN